MDNHRPREIGTLAPLPAARAPRPTPRGRSRRQRRRLARTLLVLAAVTATVALLFLPDGSHSHHVAVSPNVPDSPELSAPASGPAGHALAGMPAVRDGNLYAYDQAGMLSPAVPGDPSLIYVPK
jgi:hypothetical protein